MSHVMLTLRQVLFNDKHVGRLATCLFKNINIPQVFGQKPQKWQIDSYLQETATHFAIPCVKDKEKMF